MTTRLKRVVTTSLIESESDASSSSSSSSVSSDDSSNSEHDSDRDISQQELDDWTEMEQLIR